MYHFTQNARRESSGAGRTATLPPVESFDLIPKSNEVPLCDIIYRWVDPLSVNQKLRHSERVRDNGELRFSMRSFALLHGVRRFHIVGRGERPGWLVQHERVSFWRETELLQQLLAALNISIDATSVLSNSEVSKLVIPLVPGIAERFLLVDDDYFIIPQTSPQPQLSTRLFFDLAGIPLQPVFIRGSHRPIPMLRSAYNDAVSTLTFSNITDLERILLRSEERIDRLPLWCAHMWQAGSARPVLTATRMPMKGCFSHVARLQTWAQTGVDPIDEQLFRVKVHMGKTIRSSADSGYTCANLTHSEQKHSLSFLAFPHTRRTQRTIIQRAADFLRILERERPMFATLNDDWGGKVVQGRRMLDEFLIQLYPKSAPWERHSSTQELNHMQPRRTAAAHALGPLQAQAHEQLAHAHAHAHDVMINEDHSRASQQVTCLTGHKLRLPASAFDIPQTLQPLLSQLTVQRRQELLSNVRMLTPAELTASIANIDLIDIDNSLSNNAWPPPDRKLHVAELNAERLRYWCEFAHLILQSPELRAVDVWLLNEFDLGMARSGQKHTARRLAYALGLNYAWGAEFVELTNGNRKEQQRTSGITNKWGLHGNAILSRWPLWKGAIERMPGMDPLYDSRGTITQGGYERRLGGRMALFALTGTPTQPVLVGSLHMQTSWGRNAAHTNQSINLLRGHIDGTARQQTAMPPVLLGGDTWGKTCSWLGLSDVVNETGPTNRLDKRTGKVYLYGTGYKADDYICGHRVRLVDEHKRTAAAGRYVNGKRPEVVLSDHAIVAVRVMLM